MRILAFDTSGTWCSVALLDDATMIEREEAVGNAHSERLLPMINALLHDASAGLHSVDVIAFGAGPGSFTGVRIAASVAQGLALGIERRAMGVCTLEAVAEEAHYQNGSERVIACTDARMQEIYVACYERAVGSWREVRSPVVLKPDALELPVGDRWIGCGNGFTAYPALRSQLGLETVMPHIHATGRAIATIARTRMASSETDDPALALPLYVRNRIALTTAEREAGARL